MLKKVTIKDNKIFYDEEEFIFLSSENEPRFLNKVRFELTDCVFQDEFSLTENIPNQMILSNCDFNDVHLSDMDIKAN